MNANLQPEPPLPFCVLTYAGPLHSAIPPPEEIPLVLILMRRSSVFRVLVNPDWKNILAESDKTYFADLLADWKQRLPHDSEALREQLCSLSVGPIVTARTGPDIASEPIVAALAERFTDF